MKKKFLAVIVSFCCLMLLAGTSFAADEITDPILKKLVEKGILTKEEASSVMKDIDQEAVKAEQKVDQTIDKKVTDVQPNVRRFQLHHPLQDGRPRRRAHGGSRLPHAE